MKNDFFSAAYNKALEDAIAVLDKIAMSIDVNDRKSTCTFVFDNFPPMFTDTRMFIYIAGATVLGLVKSCIGTKFTSQFGDLIAVSTLISFCVIYVFFSRLIYAHLEDNNYISQKLIVLKFLHHLMCLF